MEDVSHKPEYDIDDELTTNEAAPIIDCAKGSLDVSRCTGTLFGVPAPKYIKRGGKVRYVYGTLLKFNSQFVEQANTAQNKLAATNQAA